MINNLSDYIALASETAVYPKASARVYLMAGLLSEVGEVAGVIKKYNRDGGTKEEFRQKLKAELGDCFWYFAMMLHDLYPSDKNMRPRLDPPGYKPSLNYELEDLEICLSYLLRVNNLIHQIITESGDNHSSKNTSLLLDIFYNLKIIATFSDLTVHEVLEYNVNKLKSRQSRNQLQGSGDNR